MERVELQPVQIPITNPCVKAKHKKGRSQYSNTENGKENKKQLTVIITVKRRKCNGKYTHGIDI